MGRSRYIWVSILLAVAFVAMLCTGAFAQQDAQFSVDFQSTDLSTALEILKRYDPSFSYTLPSRFENETITASLVDVTLDEALGIMLDQVDLTHVKDNNVYKIREKSDRSQKRGERPMPSYGSPVYSTRPVSPDSGGQAAASPARGSEDEESEEEMRRNLPPRMIQIKYSDPALMAELFGGGAIYGGDTGGGGRGGTSRGGYGGSSRGSYGSSSNRGGIGSSRGGGIGSSRSGGIGSSRSSGIGSSGSSGIGSNRSYR